MIGTASATITGDSPNPSGSTIIDINTTWSDESGIVCGGNVTVGNASQRIYFTIDNSTVEILGKLTMGGDTPVNFTLNSSTIYFNVTSGETANSPPGAVYNSSQIIVIENTAVQSSTSRIELRGSTIKGTDYSHLAGGVEIKSGGTNRANHTVIIDNINLSYVGSAIFGVGETWALETGDEFASGSSLTNITLYYCGRGMDLGNNDIAVDYVTSYGGYVAFHSGKDWNHLTMHKTIEGLYNPADYAWIRNGWFDADDTKFNIMTASHVVFEYNTVVDAHFNTGAGSYEWQGNNNTLQHNNFTDTGFGSVKTGENIINNTVYRSWETRGGRCLTCSGVDVLIENNTFDGYCRMAMKIVPHPDVWERAINYTIKDNIIKNASAGMYFEKTDNATITNTSINKITYLYGFDGYGIKIVNCTDLLFRDTSIINTDRFDITFGGIENDLYGGASEPSSDIRFINTRFDDSKINFVNEYDILNISYYVDVLVQDSIGTPISGATVTFTNEVDNASYPCIDSDGNVQNIFTTGSDGHVLLPVGNRSESPVLMDFAQNNTTTTSMTWQIGADAVGYDANNSAITGLNLTGGSYRDTPNTQQNTSIIILGGWSPDFNYTYVGRYTYYTDGSRIRSGAAIVESDKVVFTDNSSWPVVT